MTNDETHDGAFEPEDALRAAAIDALFGGEAPETTGDPEIAGELDELRGFRDRCREALLADDRESGAERASDALRAGRVARRVLARTTREDLGRRGDVGLVLDFVAERLRDSALLRVAAALLLVQLTVVPLVAWHLLRTPEIEGFRTGIEPRIEELEDDAAVEELLEDVVGGAEWPDVDDAVERMRLEDDAALLRSDLDRLAKTLRLQGDPTSDLGRALQALTIGDTLPRREGDGPVSLAEAAARAEVALFRFAENDEWQGLSESLEALVEAASAQPENRNASALVGRAFAHATLLGVATPSLEGSSIETTARSGEGRGWLSFVAMETRGVASGDAYVSAWRAAVQDL